VTESALKHLVDGLRADQSLDLDDDQVSALLSWLGGSKRDSNAQFLRSQLGDPGEDESIRATAFEQLDLALFDGDRMLVRAAGVADNRDDRERRRRFRLLLSVFHPDRFPARADWLTSRLQIVNRAYSEFKAGRLDEEAEVSSFPAVKPESKGTRSRQPVWRGISPSWTMGARLRQRLGQDRYLGHKIVAVLVLVIALPVISILLDSESEPVEISSAEEPEPIEQRWFGHDLDLAVDDWPLMSPDPEWLAVAAAKPVTEGAERGPMEWPGDVEVPRTPDWMKMARPVELKDLSESVPVKDADALAEAAEVMEADVIAAVVKEEVISDKPEMIADELEERLVVEGVGKEEDERLVAESVEGGEVLDEVGLVEGLKTTSVEVESVGLESGTLSLGLLGNHRVGRVLTEYRDSVEAGDLQRVLGVIGRNPRENENEGQEWFEHRYGELFDTSNQRSLSMQVRNVRRSGTGWLVEVNYQLEMALADSDEFESLEREVRYSIYPDPFRLRIISIEY